MTIQIAIATAAITRHTIHGHSSFTRQCYHVDDGRADLYEALEAL